MASVSRSSALYARLLRPALFRLPAEVAHDLGKSALRRAAPWRLLVPAPRPDPSLAVDLAGLPLGSPVGLAAGFDKNAEMLATFDRLGFGYVIPGTIRDQAPIDNPRPSIVRRAAEESLVNCTGLPSRGAPYAATRIAAFAQRPLTGRTAVIPSIGGFTIDEYVRALDVVQPHADAVEILLLCPNERYDELNFLHEPTFRSLMAELNARKRRPFFVKIRNFADEEERAARLRLVEACVELGVDGVTLPGSTTVTEDRLSLGRGNLTGRAVLASTIRNVSDVHRLAEGRLAIKALGGISTGEDAFRAIAAGATTVELLTGLVYRGWTVAADIKADLARLMASRGVAGVRELRGAEPVSRAPA